MFEPQLSLLLDEKSKQEILYLPYFQQAQSWVYADLYAYASCS